MLLQDIYLQLVEPGALPEPQTGSSCLLRLNRWGHICFRRKKKFRLMQNDGHLISSFKIHFIKYSYLTSSRLRETYSTNQHVSMTTHQRHLKTAVTSAETPSSAGTAGTAVTSFRSDAVEAFNGGWLLCEESGIKATPAIKHGCLENRPFIQIYYI